MPRYIGKFKITGSKGNCNVKTYMRGPYYVIGYKHTNYLSQDFFEFIFNGKKIRNLILI